MQRQHTILIVEDQEDLRSLLTDTLERLGGHHVVSAEDGVAGLEAVMTHHPDCVIVDVLMPHLDGFQFVQAMRGDPETQSIPLIVLTALAQEQQQFHGMAVGADRYLLKPARPLEIIAVIRDVLLITEQQRATVMRKLAGQ